MIDAIVGLKSDIEMLKSAFGQSLKVGPIEVVDAKKGYRIKLGENRDGAVLSPWYPHPESGGQSSSWMPLSKGQIVGVINPGGDPRQGVIFRGGFSGSHPSPSSDLAANVLSAFGVTLTITGGKVVLEGNLDVTGDITIKGNVDITGNLTVQGDFKTEGGAFSHNGTHVGSSHSHGGVLAGGSSTGGPS